MEYIKPVLDIEEMDDNGDTTFYAYNFNNWRLWFTQYNNGHIYSVSVAKQGEQYLGVSVTSDRIGGWYPNRFLVSANHTSKTTGDMRAYLNDLQEACDVIDSIEHFLYNSKHYELYCRQRVIGALEAANLGDYDLEGVEITDDDIDTLTRRVYAMRDTDFVCALIHERNHNVLEPIVGEYLLGIREVLDAGLEDEEYDEL